MIEGPPLPRRAEFPTRDAEPAAVSESRPDDGSESPDSSYPPPADALEELRRLLFVAGEAVSVETGRHLEDPVPFVLFEPGKRWPGRDAFTEVGVRENGIEVNRSHELLDFVLHL